ncbi:condensation domain-containing protein [uncultured Cellulomonas sp.]|uniref:condensation domain-containing protein n=1 Tax=uncultured Cellulomonas sp. TaxID=189682 RepID=UPI0028E659B4|nr:condensation domain-containing protein [uncultured Cellulomonas sp.]
MAAQVATAWQAVLGVEPKDGDDFFLLGGTSLRAALLTATLRADGLQLAIADVLEHPRFADLARFLSEGGAEARPAIPVVPRGSALPLSHGQEADLLGMLKDRRDGGAGESCLLPFAVLLTAATEDDVRRALAAVLARHESLRTGFVLDVQRGFATPFVVPVVEATAPVMRLVDIRGSAGIGSEEVPDAAARWVREMISDAPAVGAPPLVRFVLGRTQEGLCLVGVVDHLVCDWNGVMILLDELADRLSAPDGAPVAPARPDFVDWAAWQRRRLAGAEGRRLRDFWRRELESCGPLPTLQVPAPDEPDEQEPYVRLEHRFDVNTWRAFRDAGRSRGVGRLPVVLTTWARAWDRVLGPGQLVAHVPTANRGLPEAASIVGSMAHTLPIRLRGSGADEPLTHLDQLAGGYRTTLEHQEAPLCWLTEQLAPQDHAPPAQPRRLFVTDEEAMSPSWVWPGGRMQIITLPWAPQSAHDGVSVHVIDDGDTGRVAVVVNGRLVDVATIRRVVDALAHCATELTDALSVEPGALSSVAG